MRTTSGLEWQGLVSILRQSINHMANASTVREILKATDGGSPLHWRLDVRTDVMRELDFRRMALRFDGAVEGAHMGHPDFRVNNRIFATLHHDRGFGGLALTPNQQGRFLREHPDAFEPASGAWGRGGATTVRLAVVPEEALGEAMTLAWQNTAAKGPSRSSRKQSATTIRRSRKRTE
jgi:YjbR